MIERLTKPLVSPLTTHKNRGIRIPALSVSYIITMVSIMLAWVFFRSGSLENTITVFSNMFVFTDTRLTLTAMLPKLTTQDQVVAIVSVAILIIAEIFNSKKPLVAWLEKRPLPLRHAFIVLTIMLIIIFGIYGANIVSQFIYFQF